MNVKFPDNFDPSKQRAYLDVNGKPVFVNIPKEVREIAYMEPSEGGDPFAARNERARELAQQGHVIDTQIDVWGWGAENTMRLRRMYGYKTVPDALGQVQILVSPEK
jgi:hypothetical protein